MAFESSNLLGLNASFGLVMTITRSLFGLMVEINLKNLKKQHPNVKFTMELESNDSPPFLNVLVTRIPDGQLGLSVHHKLTHY